MCLRIPTEVCALTVLLAVTASAHAGSAPQRLACVLTDIDTASAVEHRSIAIVFDADRSTIAFEEGGRSQDLTNVSISMTSMSGGVGDMTVGVSRSSWRVVVQTYGKSSVRTEYGVCALAR